MHAGLRVPPLPYSRMRSQPEFDIALMGFVLLEGVLSSLSRALPGVSDASIVAWDRGKSCREYVCGSRARLIQPHEATCANPTGHLFSKRLATIGPFMRRVDLLPFRAFDY
jgi:hypothetical protein